jgi:hypothetical protein
MKKSRLVLSLIAFTFAIVSAFAFNTNPITYGYVDTIANPDECVSVTATCNGTLVNCKQDVDAAIAGQETIFEFASGTTCGLVQKEQSN